MHSTALASAVLGVPFAEARQDARVWSRPVETAVGAHLLAAGVDLQYWRHRNREVDYVVAGRAVIAIEVAGGRRKDALPGLDAFTREYPRAKPLLVGAQGVPLDEFLSTDPGRWLG